MDKQISEKGLMIRDEGSIRKFQLILPYLMLLSLKYPSFN